MLPVFTNSFKLLYMYIKKYLIISALLFVALFEMQSTAYAATTPTFYKGTMMTFAPRLMSSPCGIVYKDGGVPTNPFKSIKDHGGNMARLWAGPDGPLTNQYTIDGPLDFGCWYNVKKDVATAKSYGLDVFMTYFNSDIPTSWANVTDDVLPDTIYKFVYRTLDDLGKVNALPSIVAIGNEINKYFMHRAGLNGIDYNRMVRLLNPGLNAVDSISKKYGVTIRKALHIYNPSAVPAWMQNITSAGMTNFDILAISYYPQWHTLGSFTSVGAVAPFLKGNYKKDFMVLETSCPWTSSDFDTHANIYTLIPSQYSQTPSPAVQRQYMEDMATDVSSRGGIGVLYWGAEWVASSCVIYADEWGPGSSWDNNTWWDNNDNLHDGINWLQKTYTIGNPSSVNLTFRVDMTGQDVSQGVYVCGTMNGFAFTKMTQEIGTNVYRATLSALEGDQHAYYYKNAANWTAGTRETVPDACALSYTTKYAWTGDRAFTVPANDTIIEAKYNSCDGIVITQSPTLYVSPVSLSLNDKANTATFILNGVNLTDDITFTCPTGISVQPTTISKTAATNTTVTVTYNKITPNVSGNIVINSGSISTNVAITASIITKVDPGMTNLTHQWTFDDGTAKDVVGTADGTLQSGATITNKALSTTSGGYLSLPASTIAVNGYNELTTEAWFTSSKGLNTKNTVISYFGDVNVSGWMGTNYIFSSAVNSSNCRTAITTGNVTNPWTTESGVNNPAGKIDDGVQHQLVSVVNSSSITLYIDGINVASTALSTSNKLSALSNASAFLCKSGYSGDALWKGLVHKFTMYNKALSDAEILYLYSKGAEQGITTGVKNTLDNKLQVFVSGDDVIIKSSLNKDTRITFSLYDIQGKLVSNQNKTISGGINKISIGGLIPSGVYLIQIRTDEYSLITKIVK